MYILVYVFLYTRVLYLSMYVRVAALRVLRGPFKEMLMQGFRDDESMSMYDTCMAG